MKKLIVTGMLVSAGAAFAAERPTDFAYGVPLEADGKDALYEITLPAAVYRGVVRPDLGDVRVFNGTGEVVPHALRPRRMTDTETVTPVALTLFPLKAEVGAGVDAISIRVRRGPGGKSSVDVTSTGARAGAEKRVVGYLVDLTTLDPALRAIELEWQAQPDGFAGKIRVDASDDLGSWSTLVAAAPLVSLEVAGQRLQQKRVELPQRKVKYLRLSWASRGTGAVAPELTSARGEPVGKTVEAPREWMQVESAKGEKPGEYLFDLRGRQPVDRVRLQLPEINTVAQVELLARDKSETPWRPITRGVAYRLRRDDNEITSPELQVGFTTDRFWLLRVDQRGGGIGAGAPKLEAGWVPHSLVFAARGAPPFQLAYGNREAKPAAHAIESLIPGYRDAGGAKIRAAKTGAQQTINVSGAKALEQHELGGEARLKEAIDWKRWSLWGALVFGVLVLGAMAWRLVRQLNEGANASAGKDAGKPQ
ncbi:MAG TPA: DUF3999 domain-containing protein [Burkholderiales bacterium]|nr:DUF3999 domain-containing protein [Burkholderiales bacterium]